MITNGKRKFQKKPSNEVKLTSQACKALSLFCQNESNRTYSSHYYIKFPSTRFHEVKQDESATLPFMHIPHINYRGDGEVHQMSYVYPKENGQ